MVKVLSVMVLLMLAGCGAVQRQHSTASPCSAGEATYACQIERYQNGT